MNNSKKNKSVISKEQSVKASITYQSPFRHLLILTFSVFVCESAVMIILSTLPSFPILLEAFFDSILLVFFLFPMLYLFSLRPLVQNINQCKLMEKDLIMSESRLQHLLTASPAVIYSAKPSGDYGATFVSENIKEQMGFEPHEFIDNPEFWSKNIHSNDSPRVFKELSRLFEHNYHSLEYRFKHKDGNYRWMHDELRLIRDNEGNPIEIVGFWIDITDRKQAEEALKEQSERLEEKVAERTQELKDAQDQLVRKEKLAVLGQLAGGMGHELRNPLGAIKNAAYFLNMAIEQPDTEVKEALEILEKEVQTSTKIISSLLDFARPKTPVPRQVNINDIVREALSGVTIPENVEIVSRPGRAIPTVLVDPHQLAIVLGNLILNAIQAMPEAGRLEIKAEARDEKWVAVAFTDTGAGISEENLEKVFEPLYTTKAKGIGLGLALSKMLVEGQGGSIEVESEVGEGSTFTVKIPFGLLIVDC